MSNYNQKQKTAAPKPKRFGDARDDMAPADPTSKKRVVNYRSTMPPRTREGKTYPGGRAMRRALKRLSVQQSMHTASKSESRQKPGAMNS